MEIGRVSTGLKGFDEVIDRLRLGDNVVWQVDSVSGYRRMVDPFVARTMQDGRKLIYVRFGRHEPVVESGEGIRVFQLDPGKGFENFATAVHRLVEQEGREAFYVFDCLTDLLEYWHSDWMIGNFFRVVCPYLYEWDTVAYFAIMRNAHTYSTVAGIRETTQLLLDIYEMEGDLYIHPLKVQDRYSPTMFFPHLIREQEAVSITASAEAAALFAALPRGEDRLDYWDETFRRAREALAWPQEQQEPLKKRLLSMLLGNDAKIRRLCERYFTLRDIVAIGTRMVGSGGIGGKSAGMLLARKILEKDGAGRFSPYLEPHDSFYVGADVFYTYIVHNGWWKLRTAQKTREGYFRYAEELREKLLTGKFPEKIRERFMQILEYFGQSPIIVRSSSLLEDGFGNAFAGKYESVFCVNRGTPEERYQAFEQAIRTVYSSAMDRDALVYRMNRGLADQDEQMALLVQRVSGDHYGDLFFPHVAGVGHSVNLYVWDPQMDPKAGMLRLVLGLGTRAVDRTEGDYVSIVSLDRPDRPPPTGAADKKKFSQRAADVLDLKANRLLSRSVDDLMALDLKTDPGLFFSYDHQTAVRLQELGYSDRRAVWAADFRKLLQSTEFPRLMREMMEVLSRAYGYPVDIEFTVNFTRGGRFRVNLLQCRPLQTKGTGRPVAVPDPAEGDCFLATRGHFMGGNVRLPIDVVVYVKAEAYAALGERDKFAVARAIGRINAALKEDGAKRSGGAFGGMAADRAAGGASAASDRGSDGGAGTIDGETPSAAGGPLAGCRALLVGPGRWGTAMPSHGVPVRFAELCNMAAIVEVAAREAGIMPELSYGSHFFQDLVESGIFYAAVFAGQPEVVFRPEMVLARDNLLPSLFPDCAALADVIHLARTDGLELYSDISTQRLVCLAKGIKI